jgi:hypothetical protein
VRESGGELELVGDCGALGVLVLELSSEFSFDWDMAG